MFEKIKAIVLSILAIDSFTAKDGKISLTDEQKQKLSSEFGEGFADKFQAMYEKQLADTSAADQAKSYREMLDVMKAENLKQMQKMQSEFEVKLQDYEAKISKLSKVPEPDPVTEAAVPVKANPFRINMAHKHNKYAYAQLNAGMGEDVVATATIDVADLKSEFGTYLSQQDRPILKALTQPTESMKFMSTQVAITAWRATQALITSVVQQFTHKWTPLGQGTFTPITITNYRHKINVPITPDEINDSWLSFLYDEGLTPEQMPITKYMIDNLIIPKVLEDREMKLIANGTFEAISPYPSTGDAGQATGLSMDGFITQLIKLYEDKANHNINFIPLGPITAANIVDQLELFVDSLDELYRPKNMNIFISDTRYRQYKRAYRDQFPTTKNEDNSDTIDFSAQRLQPLPSMASMGHMFATPKENFIHLRHKNNGSSKIFMQTTDYDVKVFAEWWEGVGFAIEEAVFAYIDALSVINGYRAADDASKLTTYMLEDAGCTSVLTAKLAGYKAAVAAATVDYTAATLQTMVTTVNAA